MKILAIDTSTSIMGVSLLDEQRVYAETITNLKKNHSVRLMPTIDQLFSEVNWLPEDIDLIAVAQGPGSYTGVRIGVTTAKTYSWALKIPLIGVSTLEAMAFEQQFFNGTIVPIIDARRGQVYSGLYAFKSDTLVNLEYDRIVKMSEWLNKLNEYENEILFVGDDTANYEEQIKTVLRGKAKLATSPFNLVRPSNIGLIGKRKFETNQIDNAFDFNPSYLQLVEAEVNWLNSQKG